MEFFIRHFLMYMSLCVPHVSWSSVQESVHQEVKQEGTKERVRLGPVSHKHTLQDIYNKAADGLFRQISRELLKCIKKKTNYQ